MCDVIDAIRSGSSLSILEEIVDIYLFCLSTPSASRVLEVANQLLFLGIHADNWVTSRHKALLHPCHVAELTVSVWMRWARGFFPIALQ